MTTQHYILIIDDEANQRLMLERALCAHDSSWVVITAASGQEALELVEAHTPDLIITDYNMPGLSGLDVIAQVRNHGLGTRIILMTAYSSPELSEATRQLCIDHYITKPVPLSLLRRLASDVLRSADTGIATA